MNLLEKNYYVDEAGDLTLFNKRGKILLGTSGVSNFFMLGVAEITEPIKVRKHFELLRKELLSDPYFQNVPSMQPEANKTAIMFHAKDDLPEVRREVFKLLIDNPVKVQVVIRRKNVLAKLAKTTYKLMKRKLSDNDIYDDLVKRLFRNLLHKADINNIYFSKRGKKDRTRALNEAIQNAKTNFERKYNKKSDKPVNIFSDSPKENTGLQIIDYYLWALQRMYERKEDRYFNLLRDNYSLIIDLDDKRNNEYGVYYSSSNQITNKKIMLDKG